MQKAVQPKVTMEKKPKRAGATPLFRLSAAQKVRGVAPARHVGSVTMLCPRGQCGLPGKTNKVIFSVGDTLVDHTDQELTYDPLRRTEVSSADADLLHPVAGASSFQHASLNSRGEERFTPVLHGALRLSLHRSAAHKARQLNQINRSKDSPTARGLARCEGGSDPTL